MDTHFSLTWHPAERVLEVALTGMWSIDDVERYYRTLSRYVAENVTGRLHFLSDLRAYPVQTQEVASRHLEYLAALQSDSPVEREAWVVKGAVASLQAKRGAVAGEQHVAIFTERADAWAYLTVEPVGP